MSFSFCRLVLRNIKILIITYSTFGQILLLEFLVNYFFAKKEAAHLRLIGGIGVAVELELDGFV